VTTIATALQYMAWATSKGLDGEPAGLELALEQATADVQCKCGRDFVPSPEDPANTETRQVLGDGGVTLFIPDALSISKVECQGFSVGTWAAEPPGSTPITALTLPRGGLSYYDPYGYQTAAAYDGAPVQRTWPEGYPIAITGRFGYAELTDFPADLIEAACILTAIRVLDGTSWQNAASGASRISVINVTVDVDTKSSGLSQKQAQAYQILRDYVRMA
jgi:hypothetical protein